MTTPDASTRKRFWDIAQTNWVKIPIKPIWENRSIKSILSVDKRKVGLNKRIYAQSNRNYHPRYQQPEAFLRYCSNNLSESTHTTHMRKPLHKINYKGGQTKSRPGQTNIGPNQQKLPPQIPATGWFFEISLKQIEWKYPCDPYEKTAPWNQF